ncbi:ABC transporter substrate-binding protein [Tropicimonas sp.]|uniref:ABC transporter substrate-binding protein n=1 Tax=Tropicimonas sp. TaxID=2067044 RepID=UPI003A88B155
MPRLITRRVTLLSGAAALAAPAFANAAAPLAVLDIHGPPAGPSILLAYGVAAGMLGPVAETVNFHVWRNPDELRAGLTSGQMNVVAMPVQAAANLYYRGFSLKLVNVMTQGLLYVVSADPGVASVEALAGKHIAVPFRGDTPDIILDRLLAAAGLGREADLRLSHVSTPVEAVQMLMTGRADCALLPEPAISAAILMGGLRGVTLTRAVDVQEAWGALTGGEPSIPQAGLAVTGQFLEEHAALMPALETAVAAMAQSALADPAAAGAQASAALGLPAQVIAASIPHSRLGAWPAREMREPVERMLSLMAEVDPQKIGGHLPDDGFYF